MFDIILVHVLAMIGVLVVLLFLCKFIFLLRLWIKRKSPSDDWSLIRTSMISDSPEGVWYGIPTVQCYAGYKAVQDRHRKYYVISIKFLKWEYYISYQISNEV